MLLLQPLGGSMLMADAEFNELCVQLRRCGPDTEGAHSNIEAALRAPLRRALLGHFTPLVRGHRTLSATPLSRALTKCNICDSEDPFAAKCPPEGIGKGRGGSPPSRCLNFAGGYGERWGSFG